MHKSKPYIWRRSDHVLNMGTYENLTVPRWYANTKYESLIQSVVGEHGHQWMLHAIAWLICLYSGLWTVHGLEGRFVWSSSLPLFKRIFFLICGLKLKMLPAWVLNLIHLWSVQTTVDAEVIWHIILVVQSLFVLSRDWEQGFTKPDIRDNGNVDPGFSDIFSEKILLCNSKYQMRSYL